MKKRFFLMSFLAIVAGNALAQSSDDPTGLVMRGNSPMPKNIAITDIPLGMLVALTMGGSNLTGAQVPLGSPNPGMTPLNVETVPQK